MPLLRQYVGTSSNTTVRAYMIVYLACAFLVYIFVTKLHAQGRVEPDSTTKRLNQALQLAEASRQRIVELQQTIDSLVNQQVDKQSAKKLIEKLEYKMQNGPAIGGKTDSPIFYGNPPSSEPSLEYELTRRRIQNNIGEIWNFFSTELGQLRKKVILERINVEEEIKNVLILGAEHKRSLLSDMDRLRQLDGYEAWRYKESKDLSDLVQRRLRHLQNPPDCSKAKKLLCDIDKIRLPTYGSQLHYTVYCFIIAYGTERTVILKSKAWNYHAGGWEKVFQPVSDSCMDIGAARPYWPRRSETQVLALPQVHKFIQSLPYLPLALPEDLAPRMKRLHGAPYVWWVGQILQYLLRPQKSTQEFLETSMSKLGFKRPIVGVHVRRTDKIGREAAFHSIEEYMTHVEDYYLTQEINGTCMDRRIFLATDDAEVIDEALKKYPKYEIIADAEVARMASVSTRNTDAGFNGILHDIHLLSLCDYLVCTFSSQVCRMAYEIMQTHYPDAGHRFKSLDDIYYFAGQNAHNYQAVIPHKARNHDELNMIPGDLVGAAGNHWDGFSKGVNKRTHQEGLLPSFKVVDTVPTYPNV